MKKILFVCGESEGPDAVNCAVAAACAVNCLKESERMSDQVQAEPGVVTLTADETTKAPSSNPAVTESLSVRGFDCPSSPVQQIGAQSLTDYDLLICLTQADFDRTMDLCLADDESKLKLFLDFAPSVAEEDLVCPAIQAPEDFADTLTKIEQASQGLLQALQAQLA